MSDGGGHPIDHVVMPVETLDAARRLFESLGFTVAPDAAHPFGTGNACVFLADGTYVEPLAVLDRDLAEAEGIRGNGFVRRDLAYRLRQPLPAFSAVALGTADAEADRVRFADEGIDGGEPLEFGRTFIGDDGTASDLKFRLAFAADRATPETFAFACQRLFATAPDRSAMERHRNGVTGISRIVYGAADPDRCRPFLEGVFGRRATIANSLGFSLAIGSVAVDVLGRDGLAARYGVTDGGDGNLRLDGVVFSVPSLDAVRPFVGAAGGSADDIIGRLVLPLSPSGAFLAFEQAD
jgi:catechol 2,3-dioxygenase-like lactoylglutathione lyase family enzyme